MREIRIIRTNIHINIYTGAYEHTEFKVNISPTHFPFIQIPEMPTATPPSQNVKGNVTEGK